MDIMIKETGEMKELILIDKICNREVEYSDEYIAGYDYDIFQKQSKEGDFYEFEQDEFEFWREHFESLDELHEAICDLANELGGDPVDIEQEINLRIGQGTYLAEDELDMKWAYFLEIKEEKQIK